MARIVLLKDGQSIPYELSRFPARMGRHPDCDVQVDSNMVSRFHAQLVNLNNKIMLEDLSSGNGSFLNGRQLEKHQPLPLRHNDRIKLGPIKFRFENDSDDSSIDSGLTLGVDLNDGASSTIMGTAAARGFGVFEVRPEEKLRGILKINQSLAGLIEVSSIAPKILDTLFDIFPQADRGSILMKDPLLKRIVPVAQKQRVESEDESVRLSRTILERVLNDRTGILSADAASDSRFSASESISSLTIHSMMCVPLLDLEGEPFGVISLDTQNPMKRFTEEDLELLLAVANQSANAFENVRLLQSHIDKLKQDKEMKIASGVQKALLPEKMPNVKGYRFFASYDAAQAVGGDYFDCFMISPTKVCVSFGDVAGKGVPGALIMSRIASVVQNTMSFTDDVRTAIHRINAHMCHSMVEGRFVTYILGVIDLEKNRITLANAGHMSPLIRNANGDVAEFDENTIGIPIGIMDDYSYDVVERDIAVGEMFVLVTDGVDEAMNPDGDLYTKERVQNFVAAGSPDPEILGKALLADVRIHANGRDQNDDITIMTFGRL
ncbi:MAG TPA: SpoIIE family protein phosphatase [Planctomycetaceae bacterium]|nr:SpoIIE family protein phosphatase [Planctomycetaceae bacterium]